VMTLFITLSLVKSYFLSSGMNRPGETIMDMMGKGRSFTIGLAGLCTLRVLHSLPWHIRLLTITSRNGTKKPTPNGAGFPIFIQVEQPFTCSICSPCRTWGPGSASRPTPTQIVDKIPRSWASNSTMEHRSEVQARFVINDLLLLILDPPGIKVVSLSICR
jgi:hypothetical protein